LQGSVRGSEERPATTSDSKSEVLCGTADAGWVAVNEWAVTMALSFGACSADARPTDLVWIARESNPCELPAFLRLEEIAISASNMTA
jgi:hypothetical protein